MGTLDQELDKLGVNPQFRDAVGKAENVIGIISKAASGSAAAYEGVKAVLTALGYMEDEADQLKHLSDKIDHLVDIVLEKFDELFAKLQSQAVLDAQIAIAPLLGQARAGLKALAPHPPGSPEFINREDDADVATLHALETLILPPFWKRVYHAPWVFNDPWTGPLQPPVEAGTLGKFVFEYRLTMPAYLEVVALRLAVVGLIKLDPHKQFSQIAADLLRIHDTIFQGIVTLRPPTEKEIAPFYAELQIPFMTTEYQRRDSVWAQRGQKYGAVETHSGTALIDSYPPLVFVNLPPAPKPIKVGEQPGEFQNPEQWRLRQKIREEYELKLQNFRKAMAAYEASVKAAYKLFLPRYAVRTLRKRKQVYAAVGLRAVWQAVNHLRRLSGEAPLGLCDFSAWSLRELDSLVRQTTGAAPAPAGATVSLRALAPKLPAPFGGPPNIISLLGLVEA